MPTVTFDFRARGAESVRRSMQTVLDGAQRQGGPARTAQNEQQTTRLVLQHIAQRQRAYAKEAGERAKAERSVTAAAATGSSAREKLAAKEAASRATAFRGAIRAHESAERSMTTATERESRRRASIQQRAARQRGAAAGQLAQQGFGAAAGVASGLHGQFQDARRRTAAVQTSLNSTFGQTGASESEVAAMRTRFVQRMRDRHIDIAGATEALGHAQSRFSALNGDTPAARMAALEQTMRDIDLANTVDPNSLGGLPAFSAMLRQQLGASDPTGDMRSEILRNTVGISFGGSVETEDALQRGLPGMLQSLSSTLANTPAAQRGTTIRDSVTDYMAQLQTVAASGGAITVSANRMSTLRNALNNEHTQDRLGQALARRTMTDEQRTSFGQAFTRGRDGRYTMNESLRNSPSNAAAFFGGQFNNDAVALSNFLGTHGGGGSGQLMQRNVSNLLGSYFSTGTNTRGQTVRQYDLEKELRQQTLTPERVNALQRIRDGEERAKINDEDSAHDAALTDNTSELKRLSDAFAGFVAHNPVAASVLGAVAPLVGAKVLGAAAKGLFGIGGGGAAAGGGGAGVAGSVAARVAGLSMGTLALGAGAVTATGAALALQNREINAGTGTTLGQRAGAFFGGVDAQVALGAGTDARIEQIRRESDRTTQNANWNPGVLGGAAGPLQVSLAPGQVEALAAAMRASPAMISLSPQAAQQAAGELRVRAGANERRT